MLQSWSRKELDVTEQLNKINNKMTLDKWLCLASLAVTSLVD